MNNYSNFATSKSWVKDDLVIATLFRSIDIFLNRPNFIPIIPIAESFIYRSINKDSEAYETMLASEDILRREWDSPEEDEAWADL